MALMPNLLNLLGDGPFESQRCHTGAAPTNAPDTVRGRASNVGMQPVERQDVAKSCLGPNYEKLTCGFRNHVGNPGKHRGFRYRHHGTL